MEPLWQCVLCYSVVERWPRGLWRRSRKAVPDCIGTWVQIPPSPPRGRHAAMSAGFTERCWSGRTGATGNRVGEQSSRGFESHPLRFMPPSRIIQLGPVRLDLPSGTVALSSSQPRVNTPLTARAAGFRRRLGVGRLDMASFAEREKAWTVINGATASSYTPVTTDVGNYLRSTASYTDGARPGKRAEAVSANRAMDGVSPPPPPPPPPANTPPESLAIERGQRILYENTAAGVNIGRPVSAWGPPGRYHHLLPWRPGRRLLRHRRVIRTADDESGAGL